MNNHKSSTESSMRKLIVSATILALAGCGGGGGGGGSSASVAAGGGTTNFANDPVNTIETVTVAGTTAANATVTGEAMNPGGGIVTVTDADAAADMDHSVLFDFDGVTLQADPGYTGDLAMDVFVDGAGSAEVTEIVIDSPL